LFSVDFLAKKLIVIFFLMNSSIPIKDSFLYVGFGISGSQELIKELMVSSEMNLG